MKPTRQKLLKLGFLTAGAACLVAGFAQAGQWLLLALAFLAWLAGMLAAGWFTTVFVAAVGLAAAGVCNGAWPPLMILGATLLLASWDLASLEGFLAPGLPAGAAHFERRHYGYLALALGHGLLAALLGRLLSLEIPFGILAALALLVILGIHQVWRSLQFDPTKK